ncbi:uncharacterized protein LOC133179650 [Saccostrea echinata]|uniref:uncharacterized protein LOC133179650 n=1 Tax=Saccostrea echinata TaxID=191078 RepID=UPI002A80F1E1|nr:uncharacterized protein LOC133179650 [Saccostrea echinata]
MGSGIQVSGDMGSDILVSGDLDSRFKTPSAPKRPRLCRPRTLLRKRTNQNADESILPKWEVSPISNESGPILIGSDSESELACIPLEFSEEDQKENHVQEEDQEEIIIPPSQM